MRITKVTIEGKTYPLIFSLNAAEKIEDQCVPVMEPLASCRAEIMLPSRVSAAVPRVMAVYFCVRQS